MGGIFAKMDNQDKIISLERKQQDIIKDASNLNLDTLRDYINKYGFIRIEVDAKQLETYINSFGTKYFKKNLEDIKKIYNGVGLTYGFGTMMLSSYGLVVLSEKITAVEQPKEQFSNVFGNTLYSYDIYENFADTANTSTSSPDTSSLQLYILLPKIYFSNERNIFVDFLIASLPQSGTNMEQNKIMYTFVKNLLNKINETPNPEVKIVNTIGLLTRIGLIMTFFNLLQTNTKKYSNSEKMEFLTGIITDNLEDIPYDDCIFYNDKINFIKFTPNVCTIAKEEKEMRLKKLYETTCPVQEQVTCPVQEQVTCPVQEQVTCPVQEQVTCPVQEQVTCPVQEQVICPVQEQVICPVQEQVTCPACGEQKCPEHTCPTCVKTTCPESEQPSNLWKYTSLILTIIVIVMILIIIYRSSGKEENLKNLANLANLN